MAGFELFLVLLGLMALANVILMILGLVKRRIKILHVIIILVLAFLVPYGILYIGGETGYGRGGMALTFISMFAGIFLDMLITLIFLIIRIKRPSTAQTQIEDILD